MGNILEALSLFQKSNVYFCIYSDKYISFDYLKSFFLFIGLGLNPMILGAYSYLRTQESLLIQCLWGTCRMFLNICQTQVGHMQVKCPTVMIYFPNYLQKHFLQPKRYLTDCAFIQHLGNPILIPGLDGLPYTNESNL